MALSRTRPPVRFVLASLSSLTDGNLSYRQIPSFGRDAIRRFSANCSELKKMAARDFENPPSGVSHLRSCKAHASYAAPAIPVCHCRFWWPTPWTTQPNHPAAPLCRSSLAWLSKLRMHIDPTVELVETVTTSLGDKLRAFTQNTCPAFNTYELKREFDARKRRRC
jgi:hypothetical protein